MKLHCEVEVISRHLPALGLRNRGKGVRAVLSLCQQTSRSQPPVRAFLLISTLKDKRGTRYELRENIEQFFTKFVDEGKATVRLKEPPVDICLSKMESHSVTQVGVQWEELGSLQPTGHFQQFKRFPFSYETGS
ncbi:leucine rich repeat protein 1 [Homo sapiens]|uniref:Leucine rich repeat protein 1 n=1 Tax=Homo sapiens TaxID=9606 RepID=G3V5H2_HUMAN|nr:peptidylprolyl isomerase (cyclophilin)-like 5, isoform CRA_d [Homo sapiens]KAI2571133.1 leucine rich repeat protein 1 [Homo sapiens]KAI4060764.1 leucine rich repeat protein 1 [Homo sapiens]